MNTDKELEKGLTYKANRLANGEPGSVMYMFSKQDWELFTEEVAEAINNLITEARIKALTDVDNLNLLNDSDEWHAFYLSELERLKGTKQ